MYQLFIGCDMSKDKFDVSYFYRGDITYLGEFVNNIVGFQQMLLEIESRLKIKLHELFVCFENTGVYSKLFYAWLIDQGIHFRKKIH